MLTERYVYYLSQLDQRNAVAANLAGIIGALGFVALSVEAWPDPVRTWARRALYLIGVITYATVFLVGLASFLGSAGLRW